MIVDSSVAAKWFLPDEVSPAADALQRRHREGEVELVVPDLFWPEMANLLFMTIRAGRLSAAAGQAALDQLQEMDMPVRKTAPFAPEVLEMAVRWRRPAYDLFYVLLARALGDVLVTADDRLVRALGHRFPVRALASLPL